jgi:D-amino-acid dehydrogenase
MNIVVLGAGVIGVASAWYLRQAGHEVTVVEGREGPALATSYANGGQISVSHAVPWANPDAPREILHWLGRSDAPLKFRLQLDPRQWLWGLRFLFECTPGRTRANAQRILGLAIASQRALAQLREEFVMSYHHESRGILSIYTEPRAYARAVDRLRMLDAGVRRELKTPAECATLEPALAAAVPQLAGGIYAPDDESGDAQQFTQQLAQHCAQRGVRFLFNHRVQRLVIERDRVVGVEVTNPQKKRQRIAGAAYVMALGSWSTLVLASIGISVPVYPVKGYSVTIPVGPRDEAPRVSITDEERKLVFSRLGDRLRVAGTAELAGYDEDVDMRRCDAMLDRTYALFPRAGSRDAAQCWGGLRPATPGNVPFIGRTRYANLYLNTGHGTLGWTLACGSGRLIAERVTASSV